MILNLKNFALVEVSTGYDASATAVVLSSGFVSKLPNITDGSFNLVWFNSTDYASPDLDPNKEIVQVTNIVGDTLTIVRPSAPNSYLGEGTDNIAKTHNIPGKQYKMLISVTKGVLGKITEINDITKNCTGFRYPGSVIVSGDATNREVTLTGNPEAYFLGTPVAELISGWISDPHDNTPGSNFFLYHNGTNFSWMENGFPGFDMVLIAAAIWDASNSTWIYVRETHGLQTSPDDHLAQHTTIGTYKYAGGTIPSASYVLNSTTATNRRLNIDETTIRDEDNPTVLPALTSKLYTKMFLSGAGISNFTLETAEIIPVLANNPYYNSFSNPNWGQTLVPANSVFTVWIYAIPVASDSASQKYRYLFVQPQAFTQADNSGPLAMAAAFNTESNRLPSSLNLGSLLVAEPEIICIGKVIMDYTGGDWKYKEVSLLTGNKYSQIGTPAGNFLSSVAIDSSLKGNGTVSDPLGVVSKTFVTVGFSQADYICDGTSDNVQLQQAIDYVDSLGGGTVFIKNGTYNIDPTTSPAEWVSQCPKYGLKLYSNVKLIGENTKKTILTTGAIPVGTPESYFTMFINETPTGGDTGIQVKEISIILPVPIENATGMDRYDIAGWFKGVSNSIFDSCYFENGAISFMPNSTYANTATVLTNGTNTNNQIINCYAKNVTGSFMLFQGTDHNFSNNTVDHAWDDALLIGSAGRGHKITNNWINNNSPVNNKGANSGCIYMGNDGGAGAGSSLLHDRMCEILISGNHLIGSKTLYSGSRAGVAMTGASRDIKIIDNIIYDNYRGISCVDGQRENILIDGNSVYNNLASGIYAQANLSTGIVRGVKIINNDVYNNEATGIDLYTYGLLEVNIINNRIYDNQGSPTQDYSINLGIEPACTAQVIVMENELRNTTPYSKYGTGNDITRFINNRGYDLPVDIPAQGVTGNYKIQTSLVGGLGESASTQDGNPGFGGDGTSANTGKKYAQSFVASATSLDYVQLQHSNQAGSNSEGVTLTIQADNAGNPSGTPLATKVLTHAEWEVADGAMVSFVTPLTLTVGATYWIVIDRTSGTYGNTNYYKLYARSTSGYAGGVAKYTNNSDVWTAGAWVDLIFKVFYTNNCLKVDVLTLNGNVPSIIDPILTRIGNSIRRITGALSITSNAGSSHLNLGSAEFRNQECDIFAYLLYNTNISGVELAISRYPNARKQSDFVTVSTTNEKSAIFSTGGSATTDQCEVIGRFNAILSTGYGWAIPAVSIIENSKITETRELDYVPQSNKLPGFDKARYKITGGSVSLYINTVNKTLSAGATSDGATLTLPFSTNTLWGNGGFAGNAVYNGTTWLVTLSGWRGSYITFFKTISAGEWSGGETGVSLYVTTNYNI